MDVWYADTSVLVAYYCPEHLSERAERWLVTLQTAPFINLLTEIELASAVSKKFRMGELDSSSAQRILRMFRSHQVERRFRKAPLSLPEYRQAYNWISSLMTPLRTLDALHLASALAVQARVFTADTAMHQSAIVLGIESMLLAESVA